MGDIRKCSINKLKGDSLNSVSFSPPIARVSSAHSIDNYRKHHLSGSWLFYSYVRGGSGRNSIHLSVHNPNRAIVTIHARTAEILVVNKLASTLLGITEKCPVKKRLCDFIRSKGDQVSLTEVDLEPSGELVVISGKVMDLVTNNNDTIPVSVWARRLDNDEEPRCLVVMEPVERITGNVEFDQRGKIMQCDRNFALLHGYPEAEALKGQDMKSLIPSLEFSPEESIQQCTTGRSKDGSNFPLSIKISACPSEAITVFRDQEPGECTVLYKGTVWVFNNISGMITLLPDGTIHSCNTNFSLMLFGYCQSQLVGKDITMLIPTFYDDVEFLDTDSMALPPLDDDEDDSNARCGCASDGRTTADSFGTDPPRPVNPMGKHIEFTLDDAIEDVQNFTFSPSPNECSSFLCNPSSPCFRDSPRAPDTTTPRKEEPSESSSRQGSKQLSFSESQDTLHSCTNSITESDVNANILELPEHDDRNVRASSALHGDGDSPSYFSDSSDGEENLSSLAEDVCSHNVKVDSMPTVNLKSSGVAESEVTKSSTSENFSTLCHVPEGCKMNFLEVPTTRDPLQEQSTAFMGSYDSDDSSHSIPEGGFYGIGRHRDGTDLAIEYHIRKVELEDGKQLYCLWVMRDADDIKGRSHTSINVPVSYTSAHSTTTTTDCTSQESESCSSEESDSVYTMGGFSEKYTVMQQIGKGAFGCVKKAYCNTDGLLVIAKFIRKSDVYKELWIHDNFLNRKVPLEVHLLSTINHPNIVQVIDVFENERYFQMVMEKHGSGMDLFEFIERNPRMDEPLASYIFRQVVSALSYLHSLFIIHRDIKDENIILDERFHIKLIDFGSAAFMGEELFSTFCGTMEYCSPEVICGNKYRGPELEMWALGVTLYTLIFGENPFIDVEETLKAEIKMPYTISDDLANLISHLLEPDPLKRCPLPEVEQHPWTTQPVCMDDYNFNEVVSASAEESKPPKYIKDQVFTLHPPCDDTTVSGESGNCTDSDVSFLAENLHCVNLPLSTESETDSIS